MDKPTKSQKKRKDKGFLLILIGLLIISIISIAFFFALMTKSSLSERNVDFSIHSILIPDYQPDNPQQEYPIVSISIIKEVLLDTFRGEDEEELVSFFKDIVAEMQTPIATITLKPGEEQPTESPENTATFTETPELTPTPSATVEPSPTITVSPTKTLAPTSTKRIYPTYTPTPTKTKVKPKPTATPTNIATATNTHTPTVTSTFTPTSTNTHTPTATNTFTPTTDPNPDSNLIIDVNIPGDDCISVETIVTITNTGQRTTATNIIVTVASVENYPFVETLFPITLDFGDLAPGATTVQTFTLHFTSNWASQPQGTIVRVLGTITNEDSRPSINIGRSEEGITRHPGGCETP